MSVVDEALPRIGEPGVPAIFDAEHTRRYIKELHSKGLQRAEPYWNFGQFAKLGACVPELRSGLWYHIAPENVGKCLVGKVLLADGSYRKIEELRRGDIVLTLGERSLEPRQVNHLINSGVKETFLVRLYDGSEVTVTKEHPFLTKTGWQNLETLGVGDLVGVPNELPCGTHHRDAKELRLLGYLLGDGGVGHGNVNFTNANPEIIADFQACLPEGYEITPVVTNPYTYRVRSIGNSDHRGHGVKGDLRLLCEKMGIWGSVSHTKRLPDWVYTLDEEGICEILRGLFATDAHVPTTREIEYCSTSRDLIYGVKHLLLRLGVRARITVRTHTRGRNSYRLYIGAKGAQVDRLWAKLRIPGKSQGEHPCVQWLKIVEITALGEQQVWDIEVEGTHNFIGGDDIFLHNSMWMINLCWEILQNNGDECYWLDFSLDDPKEMRYSYILARTGEMPIGLVLRAGDAEQELKEIRTYEMANFANQWAHRHRVFATCLRQDGTTEEPPRTCEAIVRTLKSARQQLGPGPKLWVTIDGFHDVRLEQRVQSENERQQVKSALFKEVASQVDALIMMSAHCRKDSRRRGMSGDAFKGDDSVLYDGMVVTTVYSDVNLNREGAEVFWNMEGDTTGRKMPVHEVDIQKNKAGGEKTVLFYNFLPSRCMDVEVDDATQDYYRQLVFGG